MVLYDDKFTFNKHLFHVRNGIIYQNSALFPYHLDYSDYFCGQSCKIEVQDDRYVLIVYLNKIDTRIQTYIIEKVGYENSQDIRLMQALHIFTPSQLMGF